MLKYLLAVCIAVAAWLPTGPADAQRQIDLRCRHGSGGCFARCGVVVVPSPEGGVVTAESPVCIAQCSLCPFNPDGPPPQCSARFDCIGECRPEVDPNGNTRVNPACLAQCPAC